MLAATSTGLGAPSSPGQPTCVDTDSPASTELDASARAALPLLVQLPEHMSGFFQEAGYLETVYCELRGQARLRVRCESLLEGDFAPSFLRVEKRLAKVLIKDLSRSGVGILSHQQLWPGETFWVTLLGRRLHVRVVRCRRLADACFEIGGVVTSVES